MWVEISNVFRAINERPYSRKGSTSNTHTNTCTVCMHDELRELIEFTNLNSFSPVPARSTSIYIHPAMEKYAQITPKRRRNFYWPCPQSSWGTVSLLAPTGTRRKWVPQWL